MNGMNLTNVAGGSLVISCIIVNETSIFVNNVPIAGPDIIASNGVIYPTAGVLLPPGFQLGIAPSP